MAKVGIVCDSTCDLGLDWFEANDVTMVPLKVLFGEDSFLDWIDLQPEQFFEKLKAAPALPKTSQPSPAEFVAAYGALAEQGCDSIVSIHLTAALSGTFESATLAAKDVAIPVHVVDTKSVTQATGLIVKLATELRDEGLDAESIALRAREATARVKMFFILDTLEYLVKGGRAGKAQGLAASLLNIKPVLTFNQDGIIEPFKKVKGLRKAMAELAAHVAEQSRGGKIRLSFFHACSPDLAEELKTAFDEAGVDYDLDSIGLVGAVIGTYAGPRSLGAAYLPRS
ncbi:MAG: DegV family protein [Coriobacteriia bacterium]|nr:DegV family protein [Coriobacteriia bacterium]